MQVWKDYQEKNKARFLNEMMDLLRIPSVSAKSEHKADMQKCAEAVKKSLLAAGADKAEVMPTDGHPVVYGEKIPIFLQLKSGLVVVVLRTYNGEFTALALFT